MKLGDCVRLKDKRSGSARIVALYRDIRGGVKLDKPLAGFYSWNVTDLEKVK